MAAIPPKPPVAPVIKETPNDPPNIGVTWTRKSLFVTFLMCLALSTAVICGFFFYKEFIKQETGDSLNLPNKPEIPNAKLYSNDYWGVKFAYPGSWWPVIGSFEEGKYYFASEPLDFVSELREDQALMELQTYNNLKRLPFEDWLAERENNYFPYSTILSKTPTEINGYKAEDYLLELKKPEHGTNYWEIMIVSKDDLKKYIFILETKDKLTHDQFQDTFYNILKNTEFYNGFGT